MDYKYTLYLNYYIYNDNVIVVKPSFNDNILNLNISVKYTKIFFPNYNIVSPV